MIQKSKDVLSGVRGFLLLLFVLFGTACSESPAEPVVQQDASDVCDARFANFVQLIVDVVSDVDGTPITSGVVVSARADGEPVPVERNEHGTFISSLPGGTYSVQVVSEGFSVWGSEGVEIAPVICQGIEILRFVRIEARLVPTS